MGKVGASDREQKTWREKMGELENDPLAPLVGSMMNSVDLVRDMLSTFEDPRMCQLWYRLGKLSWKERGELVRHLDGLLGMGEGKGESMAEVSPGQVIQLEKQLAGRRQATAPTNESPRSKYRRRTR